VFLAIDTSTRYAGVALADRQRIVLSRSWYSEASHTAELMPAVTDILRGADLEVGGLEGIVVALGPGGFSSLRVGVSVAKGLAYTARLPLVGIGTLDLEAFPYLKSGLPVCALMNSGRDYVAFAHFGINGKRIRQDVVCPPGEFLNTITELTLFCGEGLASWAELIKDQVGPNGLVMANLMPAVRVCSLVDLGRQRLIAGDISDMATLQPNYLRMPSTGGPKHRDWAQQRS
jgi:tRNA threonylcarbamoyladenosine biosynthesis protein TsaB